MQAREKPESYVPSWDGNSRSWRRYVKEISWYIGSTKAEQRRYIASKLISRLTGSARLLAMSWTQQEFEGEHGVLLLLRRFASSPLVRRSLPNAAAIMGEYFNFKRRPGEAIAQFLVRETLGFEEFQEALLQLKAERDGVDPAAREFGLPSLTAEASPQTWSHQRWRDWRSWQPHEHHDDGSQAGAPSSPQREDGYKPVPTEPPPEDPSSPKPPSQKSEPLDGASRGGFDGGVLGPMDTFILDVLRGWRLLVAASLSPEEWRDVLATTGNKLEYLQISDALLTLWDEQLGGNRGGHQTNYGQAFVQQQWHDQDSVARAAMVGSS